MMQEVEVLKTIPELVCSYFSEEQFTLSKSIKWYAKVEKNGKIGYMNKKYLV